MKKTVLFIFLLCIPLVNAELYIANSGNWHTTYSAGILASINGQPFNYLISQKHSESIQTEITPGATITVIESTTVPYVKNYANRLSNNGFKATTILVPEDNANLDLAQRSGVKTFIIVDPTYAYNAISAIPYATATKTYVLFANRDNINAVSNFLQTIIPEQLTILGDVDTEVSQALQPYNPQLINEGSRFKDNIKLAELARQETNAKQLIFTNGAFLEPDFFTSKKPIIYIGTDTTPDETLTYLQQSPYEAAVVIGNQLIGSAEYIKDETQLSVFIKFAKGVSGAGELFKDVQGLDTYPVPVIDLLLTIEDIYYNLETQQIELIINNKKDARTYLTNNILISGNGQPIQTVGDDEPQLIQAQTAQGYTYDADLSEHLTEDLTADILTTYGATPTEYEKELSETRDIIIEENSGTCDITINRAEYDKDTQRFKIHLSSDDCYARVELQDVIIGDQPETLTSSTEAVKGTTIVQIKQRMDDVDLADNPTVNVRVTYGSRANILNNAKEETLTLHLGTPFNSQTILIGIIAILAIIIIILLWKRKK